MERQTIGRDAEQQALYFLKAQGLKLVTQNYSSRFGEIDLIMQDHEQLVFIEVRSRSYTQWGGAAFSVDSRKQRKLYKTANLFLSQNSQLLHHTCRFDVIAFEATDSNSSGDSCPIWYKDAFRPEATF